jgi:hypothetical protein
VQKMWLPVVKYASRAMPEPSAFRALMLKRRSYVIAMAISLMVVTAMGIVTVHGLMTSQPETTFKEGETRVKGNSVTTNISSSTSPLGDQSMQPKTSVTVNDQPITVPPNGSVSKTITTDNGTTHINVTNNSSNSGTAVSSNVSSTSLNVSSSSFSNNISVHSP